MFVRIVNIEKWKFFIFINEIVIVGGDMEGMWGVLVFERYFF